MPSLFRIMGYQISFWSNEIGESIHVRVSKGGPSEHGYKLWLLSNGTFVPADPKDKRIPKNELKKIITKLNNEAVYIRNFWITYFHYEKYYR